jgi:hypothetical protein
MGMLGWGLTIAGLLIGLVSLAAVVGCFVAPGHVATRTLTLKQSPEAVWGVVRSGESWPQWWDILKTAERLPDRDGQEVWRLVYKDGNKFQLRVETCEAPCHLALRIDDEGALFGGTWSYAIRRADGGSEVALTENGEIYNPVVRLMSKFLMDPHMYIDMHLKALAAKLGETAVLR